MSNENSKPSETTREPASEPKQPSHIVYHTREDNSGKAHFNRVGAAFAHGDGEGFNVLLDAVPVDGKLTMRTLKERVQAARDGDAPQQRGQDMSREP